MKAAVVAQRLVDAVDKIYVDDDGEKLFKNTIVKTGADAKDEYGCDAIIIAEEWPYEWATEVPGGDLAPGVYAEPMNGYSLAFYRPKYAATGLGLEATINAFLAGFSRALRADVGGF